MKADKIIKNAKIYTANKDNPQATALAVKDGKLYMVYSASDSKDDGYCLGLLEFTGNSAEEMLEERN